MDAARIALKAVGMAFILAAVAVLYYQTGIRDVIPEGVFLAVILVLTGLFVISFASDLRSYHVHNHVRDVERVERVDHTERVARPARPVRRTYDDGRDVDHHEEYVERRV